MKEDRRPEHTGRNKKVRIKHTMKRTYMQTITNADELKIGFSQNSTCEFHTTIKKQIIYV